MIVPEEFYIKNYSTEVYHNFSMHTTFRSEERLVLQFLRICNQTKYYDEVSMRACV